MQNLSVPANVQDRQLRRILVSIDEHCRSKIKRFFKAQNHLLFDVKGFTGQLDARAKMACASFCLFIALHHSSKAYTSAKSVSNTETGSVCVFRSMPPTRRFLLYNKYAKSHFRRCQFLCRRKNLTPSLELEIPSAGTIACKPPPH